MTNVRERLDHARRSVAPEPGGIERLGALRRRRMKRRRVAGTVLGFAFMAASVGGAMALLDGLQGRAEPGATSGTGPNMELHPGEYVYWRLVHFLPDSGHTEGGRAVVESWWGADGSGQIQASSGTRSYAPPDDQSWEAGNLPGRYPFESDLSGLSPDPDVLVGQLLQRSAPGGASPQPAVTMAPWISPEASQLWRSVSALFEAGNATPALRMALFEVAAGIAGVERQDAVLDPVGRPAMALTLPAEGALETTLYFDPSTTLFLASTGSSGEWTQHVIVTDGGMVGSRDARPKPEERLIPPPVAPVPGR